MAHSAVVIDNESSNTGSDLDNLDDKFSQTANREEQSVEEDDRATPTNRDSNFYQTRSRTATDQVRDIRPSVRRLTDHLLPYLEGLPTSVKILDVVSGNGQLGMELHKSLGARVRLDAIEPRDSMTCLAEKLGIYTAFFNVLIGESGSTNLTADYYDCVCSATSDLAILPVESIKEMIRITKVDGLIGVAVAKSSQADSDGYVHKLDKVFNALESEGACKKLLKLESAYDSDDNTNEGVDTVGIEGCEGVTHGHPGDGHLTSTIAIFIYQKMKTVA